METVFYTPQEVADLLKLRVITVYDYIKMGKLTAARFGNRYRIAREDLEAFLEAAKRDRKHPGSNEHQASA